MIDQDGSQAGVVTIKDALYKAEQAGLDLVEIAQNVDPPVCKILDFGKFTLNGEPNLSLARFKEGFGSTGAFRNKYLSISRSSNNNDKSAFMTNSYVFSIRNG